MLSAARLESVVKLGGRLQLRAGTTNVGPTPRYQWWLNQSMIPGATNSVWEVGSLRSSQSGTYQIWMSNTFGVSTSVVADVVGKVADLQILSGLSNGVFWFQYPEAAPEDLALETTENLRDWKRVQVFYPTNATPLRDVEAGSSAKRYFRVVPTQQ